MKSRSLIADRRLPLLIEPEGDGGSGLDALQSWAGETRDWIEDKLCRHGALLFRGFALETVADFQGVCRALGPELQAYVGGDSPRRALGEGVYNSTDFPAHLQIELHNELSYAGWWPNRIYFFCRVAPAQDGQTQIADSREILRRLDPGLRRRFAERQVRYFQNLRDEGLPGEGKSWQATFETGERAAVEAYCREADMEWRWTERGLSTSVVRPGVLRHPVTGEEVWFNQADQWHAALAGVKHQEAPPGPLSEAEPSPERLLELPCHVTFGDGGAIDPADLMDVRRVYAETEVLFSWRRGDLLLLDNVLTAHGRKPFKGAREILAAMA